MPRGGKREGAGRKSKELKHFEIGAFCENEFNKGISEEFERLKKLEIKPIQHIYDKQKKIPVNKRSIYLNSEEYLNDIAVIEDFLVCWQGFEQELEEYYKNHEVSFELIDKFEKVRVIALKNPNRKSKFTFKLKNKIIKKAMQKFQLQRNTVVNYWGLFKSETRTPPNLRIKLLV